MDKANFDDSDLEQFLEQFDSAPLEQDEDLDRCRLMCVCSPEEKNESGN